MARTSDEILAQQLRMIPGEFGYALTDLFVGNAAALARVETVSGDLKDLATFGDSEGMWLDLHAHGQGLRRTTNETDESLIARLRGVRDAVTRPAILTLAQDLAGPTATVAEWWEGGFLDIDFFADVDILSGGPNSFVVTIPATTDLDAVELLIFQVESSRAAGVFWRLVYTV